MPHHVQGLSAVRRSLRAGVCLLFGFLLSLSCLPAVAAQKPAFKTSSLSDAMEGVFYGARLEADQKDTVFGVVYNNESQHGLPPGLKILPNGALYGYPMKAGTYSFRLIAGNAAGDEYRNFTLVVHPFDASKLKPGGDPAMLALHMNDTPVGVSNPLMGGRALLYGDTAYVINRKGFLLESKAPFKKTVKRFPATAYGNMDARDDMLYYYQRYLDQKGVLADLSDSKYVQRITRDPLGPKGRHTLAQVDEKEVSSLKATAGGVYFVNGGKKGVLQRVELEGGITPLRVYRPTGGPLFIRDALYYQGVAYLKGEDGLLYRMYLDGELAYPITNDKVESFTIAFFMGVPAIVYTDQDHRLYYARLDGNDRRAVDGVRAKHLNSDGQYLYFADPKKKNAVCRLSLQNPEDIDIVTKDGADRIYVFNGALIYLKKGGRQYYLQSLLDLDLAPVRLNKE